TVGYRRGNMSYKVIDFLSDTETKLLYLLKENLSEKYAILVKVRLSEFLYSTQPEGSECFYTEFQSVNLVTIPFGIFDTLTRKLVGVIFLNENGLEGQLLLEQHGVICEGIGALKDALLSEKLEVFMK
ncbi:DNA distortion polypeptide 3, partial [Escherichia coli]